MRKHMTIRGGLVATIAIYTVLLIAVIAVGILGLYGSNSALGEMYRDDTASVLHLKNQLGALAVAACRVRRSRAVDQRRQARPARNRQAACAS